MTQKWPVNITDLHLELSSNCQATCPGCSRPYDYNPAILNSKTVSTWTLAELIKMLPTKFIINLETLLLCGNYGDPLFFNEINEWLNYLFELNPRLGVTIHTNGGAGSLATWSDLGKTLNRPNCFVKFSLDGLKDTNHIYRRGVSWDIALRNAEIFISNGGKAIWKFLIFKHNNHQIEIAQDLSKKLGFKKFEVKTSHSPDEDYVDYVSAHKLDKNTQLSFKETSLNDLLEVAFNNLDSDKISCQAIERSSLYIDADKRVWPCCWLSQDGDHRTRTQKRELFHRQIYDNGIEVNFNSLSSYSLNEIVGHSFFQTKLPESWTIDSIQKKNCFPTCLKTCGQR